MTGLVKKEIDGKKYEFHKLGTKEGLRIFNQLLVMIGEPLVLAIAGLKGSGPMLQRDIDGKMVGAAVHTLASRMQNDGVIDLIENLTATKALCEGKKINFDTHYASDYEHLFNVLRAALEVQYGNFIAKFMSALNDDTATTKSEPQAVAISNRSSKA